MKKLITLILAAAFSLSAMAKPWTCLRNTDDMDGHAEVYLNITTETPGGMFIVSRGSVIVGISRGVIDCSIECRIRIKVGTDMRYYTAKSVDYTTLTVKMDTSPAIAASEIKVELPMFQTAPRVLTFTPDGPAPACDVS